MSFCFQQLPTAEEAKQRSVAVGIAAAPNEREEKAIEMIQIAISFGKTFVVGIHLDRDHDKRFFEFLKKKGYSFYCAYQDPALCASGTLRDLDDEYFKISWE